MKLELLKTMSRDDLLIVKEAYLKLQSRYEDVCGGPMRARQYKEYFAICDNITAINRVLYEREINGYGTGH